MSLDDLSSGELSVEFSTFALAVETGAEAAFFFSSASYPPNSSLVLGNSATPSKFLSFYV